MYSIIPLLTETAESLGKIPDRNICTLSLYSIKLNPIDIIPFTISMGESLLILFVPECTNTPLIVDESDIFFALHRICCVESPLIPQLM